MTTRATDAADDLFAVAAELLADVDVRGDVRLLGIGASNFTCAAQEQLFDAYPDVPATGIPSPSGVLARDGGPFAPDVSGTDTVLVSTAAAASAATAAPGVVPSRAYIPEPAIARAGWPPPARWCPACPGCARYRCGPRVHRRFRRARRHPYSRMQPRAGPPSGAQERRASGHLRFS